MLCRDLHLDKCANCVGRRGAPRHGPVLLLHDHGLPLDTHQVCRGPGHRQLLQRQLASQTLVIQDGEIKHKADHFAVSLLNINDQHLAVLKQPATSMIV